MVSIVGIVVVFGAMDANYLMEHSDLKVLMQPAELIIILGAVIGTVLIANPLHILTRTEQLPLRRNLPRRHPRSMDRLR